MKSDPFTGYKRFHGGIDIGNKTGTPVYAIADGVISYSGPMGGYGWLIIVEHPEHDVYSLYGHLSTRRWKKESGAVERGELIAHIGDSDENGSSSARIRASFRARPQSSLSESPGLGAERSRASGSSFFVRTRQASSGRNANAACTASQQWTA